MKPKNDEEKYPQKYRFQAPKPPKMKSKIQKILSQKIIEKYVQKRRKGRTGTPGSRPRHTKGGDCLGISPPRLKGRERKEAHEPGQMQDLKPKTTKKKLKKMQKNNIKNLPKWGPKSFKILSWRPLGASWGALGASWASLGRHIGPS